MLGYTFTLNEIALIVGAELTGNVTLFDHTIQRVATDSRYKGIGEATLFFALKTERNDGHSFIADAMGRGVRCFVVRQDYVIPSDTDAAFLRVGDPLEALQQLAIHFRKKIQYPVLGITGSNGKTITKEWLYQLLSTSFNIQKSPKSYNSQVGVPIALLQLQVSADLGIMEAGISSPGEMDRLEKIIQPDLGLITNVHTAHLENFSDKKQLAMEKVKLFRNCKSVIYRSDYIEIDIALKETIKSSGCQLISWSSDSNSQADAIASWVKKAGKTEIGLALNDRKYQFTIPFVDDASVENAIHCMMVVFTLKIDLIDLIPAMDHLPPVAMRLQQLSGINNCTIVNDTYNSDLTSLEIALQFLHMQNQHEKRTLILSDIYHTGKSGAELYGMVNEMCKTYDVGRLIGIGAEISAQQALFEFPVEVFASTSEFLNVINRKDFFNEAILIKGSRNFGFERISRALESKSHETTLEVNLSALIDNLNFFKSKLNPGTKLMVMVKAFSYGTGSFEIANVLQHHGVHYLAVAFIDEGIALRNKGIQLPIMVLNPSLGNLDAMVRYSLEPEIFNLSSLSIVDHFLRHTKQELKVHLKLESGMHRLGIEMDEMEEVLAILKTNKWLNVVSVLSHLAATDNSSHDDYTVQQINRFSNMAEKINESTGASVLKHILNSDGILRFPSYHFDMVRLGIGLYGISSVPEFRKILKPVIQVKTLVSQVKTLKKGESIGYNRNFVADRDMKTATIPIGYADGFTRLLGNGNWRCRIGDKLVPVIGNVCMDMCFLDVTDIADIREKDEVLVLGLKNNIYEMAEKRGTIPYEILTAFPERIKRVFYYGD